MGGGVAKKQVWCVIFSLCYLGPQKKLRTESLDLREEKESKLMALMVATYFVFLIKLFSNLSFICKHKHVYVLEYWSKMSSLYDLNVEQEVARFYIF